MQKTEYIQYHGNKICSTVEKPRHGTAGCIGAGAELALTRDQSSQKLASQAQEEKAKQEGD